MWPNPQETAGPNPQETADLVTFTEEILNGKPSSTEIKQHKKG